MYFVRLPHLLVLSIPKSVEIGQPHSNRAAPPDSSKRPRVYRDPFHTQFSTALLKKSNYVLDKKFLYYFCYDLRCFEYYEGVYYFCLIWGDFYTISDKELKPRRWKTVTTLETSGEDRKTHPKRAEKMEKHTRKE